MYCLLKFLYTAVYMHCNVKLAKTTEKNYQNKQVFFNSEHDEKLQI